MSSLLATGPASVQASLKDSVSPHKLALLEVILEYCISRNKQREHGPILPGSEIDKEETYDEKEERDFMFLLLQLIQVCGSYFQDMA